MNMGLSFLTRKALTCSKKVTHILDGEVCRPLALYGYVWFGIERMSLVPVLKSTYLALSPI